MRKFTLFRSMLVAVGLMAGIITCNAQFSIVAGNTNYTQDFNALPTVAGTWANNSTLTGWYAKTDATSAISAIAISAGSSTTAGLYSFGTASSTDRSFGFVPSNTFTGASATGKGYLGWRLVNNTGKDISALTVKWTGEQWRKENNATIHSLNLSYQIGTTVTDLSAGTWIATTSKFESPIVGATTAAALDGNLAANKSVDITVNLIVTIPNGSEIMLRWDDLNDSGNDHQMAIDDVVINASVSDVQIVATPTLSLASANYSSNQSLEITCNTADAQIYYTTDGSIPDNTKSLYTSPINISATTTVNAIAYKAGFTASSVATATYTFPTSVANLAALRTATHPGFYKLTGEAVLTFKSTSRNTKYVQDATGAVVIDDLAGKMSTSYNLGDGITGLVGTTAFYNGMLQFTPVADAGASTSSNNTITPAVVTLDQLSAHQAELVTVANVSIDASTSTFAASTNYNLNASSSTIIRTQYADLNYIGTNIPTTAQNITGVVLIYNSTSQIIPRSSADFSTVTSVTEPVANLKVTAVNGKIYFDAAAGNTVSVYNTTGKKILSQPTLEGRNVVAIAAQGVVFVKVGNQTAKVVL